MSSGRDNESGSLRVDMVNWRQRVYVFPYEIFPDKPIFYKKGDPMADSKRCKELYVLSQSILELQGVLGVLYFGFGMTVCKDIEQSWENIEDGLKGALDKCEFPRPIRPAGTMQQGWELIVYQEEEQVVDYIIKGRKLMTHLSGRRFTRSEWDEAVREDRQRLEYEMRPRGFHLVEKLFEKTEASSITMMSTQINLEFAKDVDPEKLCGLRFLVSELIRGIG
jgi:hypothetical protein